jgi:O-antigen/teichoic acid export membrane protein
MLYGFLFCGLEFLLAEVLCQGLYGNLEAGKYLRLYALLMPMLYCDAVTDAMTKGLGQQKVCVRYNILTSAMDVALLFILLPRYGMVGYFFSFLVTHLLNFALSLRRLLKISQVTIRWHIPILAGIAAAAALFLSGLAENALLKGFGYIGILLSLLALMGIVGKEDVRWIKNLAIKK